MKVVLVTKSDDNESVDMVAAAVERKGGTAHRLDTDLYPTDLVVSSSFDGEGGRCLVGSGAARFDLREVEAIWHRRLAIAARVPADMDVQLRQAATEESRRSLLGSLASRHAFVMDSRADLTRANHKELQLELAREVGLDVPRTLISNDPEAVREFADRCNGEVVTKMMTSFAVYEDGQEQVVFTNPVSAADLEDLDGLRFCPMTFQERLAKATELRVTVVGERVFSASIDSQQLERSREDWRREGLALAESWVPYELPAEVERGLLTLMDRLRLNYGAADFVVTPEGRYVFLEVNPVGEFFWLERSPGFPISDAIADVLLGRVERRGSQPGRRGP